MNQSEVAGQVPGELLWKEWAVLAGLKENEKWKRNHVQLEERGVRTELWSAQANFSWC